VGGWRVILRKCGRYWRFATGLILGLVQAHFGRARTYNSPIL
jgi:hypothetical protein